MIGNVRWKKLFILKRMETRRSLACLKVMNNYDDRVLLYSILQESMIYGVVDKWLGRSKTDTES